VAQINGSGSRKKALLREESELEQLIRELFESQKLAVLGTQNKGQLAPPESWWIPSEMRSSPFT
jgi:hypothetical protein